MCIGQEVQLPLVSLATVLEQGEVIEGIEMSQLLAHLCMLPEDNDHKQVACHLCRKVSDDSIPGILHTNEKGLKELLIKDLNLKWQVRVVLTYR